MSTVVVVVVDVDVVYTASGRCNLSFTLDRQINSHLLLPDMFSMLMECSISKELHIPSRCFY